MSSSGIKELKGGDFDAEVLRSDKPVILDFTGEHCGACRMLGPILDSLVQEHGDELRVLKVDPAESPDLAARFNVRSLPTLLFFRDGELKGTHIGTLSKDGILKRIRV